MPIGSSHITEENRILFNLASDRYVRCRQVILVQENGRAWDYRWYNCDEMIAERLGPELPEEKGNSTLNLAKWMGQPFSEGYH